MASSFWGSPNRKGYESLEYQSERTAQLVQFLQRYLQAYRAYVEEQRVHIQTLEAHIQTLEAHIQTLEAHIQTLEARNQTLEARQAELEIIKNSLTWRYGQKLARSPIGRLAWWLLEVTNPIWARITRWLQFKDDLQ
jgi:chromosome segregation ATPase